MAQPTNPALWGKAKKKARQTSEGSPPGRWSPRKAAMARLEYEKAGGKWKGAGKQGGGDDPKERFKKLMKK